MTAKPSRRAFLRTTVLAAGVMAIPGRANAAAPSERITIGMIGVGRQGTKVNLKQFLDSPNAQVVAVCDVDAWRLQNAKAIVQASYSAEIGKTYKGCAAFRDFRELLALQDIDAVMVSTPDHWHVPASLAALKAGKHVACEKPLTTAITHGRQLCDAAKASGLVTRTDSEFRSLPVMQQAVQAVHNGRIGDLQRIVAHAPGDTEAVGVPEEQPVPDDLDYEMWLGPAPEKPYTELRVHPPRSIDGRPGWLRITDYAEGMITNWGSHLNDIAQWANRSDRSGPVRVEGSGSFSEGLWDTIVSFRCRYEYENGVTLEYDMGQEPGIEFYGSDGWIKVRYPDGIEASEPGVLRGPGGHEADYSTILSDKEDFLKAIRDGAATVEPFEVGHRTVSLCQIGLIAVQTGKPLEWDPEKERVTNDDSANALLTRETRGNWMQ